MNAYIFYLKLIIFIVVKYTYYKVYDLPIFKCTFFGIKYILIVVPSAPPSPELLHLP